MELENFDEDYGRKAPTPKHNSDWTAVLGKLGGSSPGSAENLQLAEKFKWVKFPANRVDVFNGLHVGASFKARSVILDLREAVDECHTPVFRSMNDLIDCIKDALRKAEKLETQSSV